MLIKVGRGITRIHNGERISVGNLRFIEEELSFEKNLLTCSDIQKTSELSSLIDKGYHYQYLLNKGNGQVSQDHSTICRVRDSSLTTSFVAIDKQIIGAILFEDTLRDEAKEAVARIKAMGITVIMLTGDNEKIAKRLADEANIDEYRASLLPQDKVSEIEKIVNRQKNEHNKRVVMVGDGINDAPALAKADVGIAMGKTGTDVAVETADVILMTENLLKIPDLINASRHTLSAIQQNFFGTLFVDGIGFVLAMTGYLNPLLAAIIHVVSELVFMVNSARLLVDSSGFYKHS